MLMVKEGAVVREMEGKRITIKVEAIQTPLIGI